MQLLLQQGAPNEWIWLLQMSKLNIIDLLVLEDELSKR